MDSTQWFSYYYSQPASVSRCHAHSRPVVFHTLHRDQRDTRLCPLISSRFIIFTKYSCSVPRVLLYFPLLHYYPPSPSVAAATASRAPPYQGAPFSTTASLLTPLVPFLNPHRVVPDPDGTIYLVDINKTHYWGSFCSTCVGVKNTFLKN